MSGVLVDREALEARIREELERNWQALPYATPHGLAFSLATALALPAQAAADAAGVQEVKAAGATPPEGHKGGPVPQEIQDRLRKGERCHADRDGDCDERGCPQLRDGEPARSGRHCPLDLREDYDW